MTADASSDEEAPTRDRFGGRYADPESSGLTATVAAGAENPVALELPR